MQVLILGAGGVGGYVGSKLVAAGADVVFLARGQRMTSLQEQGLIINSPLGNFSAPVRTVRAAISEPPPDLIVIACKAPALQGALETIEPATGPKTRVLSLLNGVAHLEVMQRQLGSVPVLGGVAHGALNLRQDGVVEHLTPFFSMIAGPALGHSDPVAEELVELLSKAKVDARLSDHIRQDMWNKFVFLTTLAGTTCLMRASAGTILASEGGEQLVLQLLEECLAVARMEGFTPDTTSMSSYRRVLTERGSTLTSSMLRDVQSGRHTEADHILGDMLRRANRNGIDAPLLKIANAHLQCYEATVV
jgi:2-dehydropantoate 2-reductase